MLLSRNVAILLGARVTMSAARAIAGVITALYLAAEGFSGVELGELFLTVTLASAVMTSGIGLLADRVGNKIFLVTVPLLTAAAALVFGFSSSAPVLFVVAALGSFGRGGGAGGGTVGPYRPAEAAMASRAVEAKARNTMFGRLTFASTLGAIGGGLIVGLVQPGQARGAAAVAGYRPAFLAAAFLAAFAGVIALGLRDTHSPERADDEDRRWYQRGFLPRRSWSILWRFWITNGINGVAIGMIGPFMSYWFALRYGASPASIGILFAVVNAATLISILSAAPVAKRMGTVKAIVLARAISGVLLVPMALSPTFGAAGAIYLVRMVAQRLGLPLRQSFVQGVADPREQASVAGLSNLPSQGTQAGTQVLAGYLFDEVNLALPFELAAGFQLLNALAYSALFRRVRPVEEREARPKEPGPSAQPEDGPP
ncbi:MAG: MFS transporter [Candidatus Dormibacteria bacterium]